jgi:hypothetical protein
MLIHSALPMKKRTIFSPSTLWILLSFILSFQMSKAQNSPAEASQNEPALTGSSQKSEDIVVKADAVFVGEITTIGFGGFKAPGESVYRGVQIKVLQVFRGTVADSIAVTLHVVGRMEFHEDPPKVGNSYILFVKKSDQGQPDAYTVLKLILATDANIAKVKALIAAVPASKNGK